MPHVSEPLYVDTQSLCHKRFIWTITNRFCCHTPFCAIFAYFCQFHGWKTATVPAAGSRDHMPLTMDLVTTDMRHSPDTTRGRWDHEKIEELLLDPVARLTFFKQQKTKHSHLVDLGLTATEATPDDAWENLVQLIQETTGPYLHQGAPRPARPLALERRRLLLELGTARRLTGSSGDQSLVETAKTEVTRVEKQIPHLKCRENTVKTYVKNGYDERVG